MKKIISILLALTMLAACSLAFAGCSKKDNKKFDLVMITDGGKITDNGCNQSAWNGVESFAENNNMTCRYYQPNLNDEGELEVETIEKYFELAVKAGAQYVILPGEAFAVSCYEIAPRFSDVKFVLVDAFPHSEDDNSVRLQANVECVSFNDLQSGFLAGYSSVIDGFTKLGYLGSVTAPKSGNYGAGFVQGAAYAADETGTPVMLEYADYDSPILDYNYSFTVRPVYQSVKDAKEDTFKVTVVNGIGSGVYTDGENVTVSADNAPEGKVFDHWEVKSDTEGVKDKKVNISSKTKSSMNLLVGDCDCTITAVWKDAVTYPVTIMEADTSTVHEVINTVENSTAWITPPAAQPGLVFDHWECTDESAVEDINSASTNVNVSNHAVSVVPVYTTSKYPTFNVTVENGTGSGSYVTGDKIDIIADPPKDGEMFLKWENVDMQNLSTGISMDNEYCYRTSFEMVDRYASIVEGMYDKGTQIVFGGGNPLGDSIFTAIETFDYPVYAFGSVYDQSGWKNCRASVVNDYGEAVKQVLTDFKGGSIFSADCSNNCIYVTDKSIVPTYKDKDGNDVDDKNYNKGYADVYEALSNKTLVPVNVQSGGDVRQALESKCLTLNYWIVEE